MFFSLNHCFLFIYLFIIFLFIFFFLFHRWGNKMKIYLGKFHFLLLSGMLIASISQEHTQTMSFKAWCSDKILQVKFYIILLYARTYWCVNEFKCFYLLNCNFNSRQWLCLKIRQDFRSVPSFIMRTVLG